MADNNQDSKEDGGGGSSKYIKLKVVCQDGNEINFRVKMSTQLGKLKRSFSERMGVQLTSLRFFFDGRRIHDDDIPTELKMENNDVVEVYEQQVGGAGMKI